MGHLVWHPDSHIYSLPHCTSNQVIIATPQITHRVLTFGRNLSHLNENRITELPKLDECQHPTADVHLVLLSYVKTVYCLLGVWLHLQLMYRNTYRGQREKETEQE